MDSTGGQYSQTSLGMAMITHVTKMHTQSLNFSYIKGNFGCSSSNFVLYRTVLDDNEYPFDSHSLSLWIKDSAAKYEVTARAPKIDFSVTLPLMYEANFSEQNNRCFLEKLRDWVCILVTCVIMAWPSKVCEYCPTVESIELPTQRKDWCDDNMPKLS